MLKILGEKKLVMLNTKQQRSQKVDLDLGRIFLHKIQVNLNPFKKGSPDIFIGQLYLGRFNKNIVESS